MRTQKPKVKKLSKPPKPSKYPKTASEVVAEFHGMERFFEIYERLAAIESQLRKRS